MEEKYKDYNQKSYEAIKENINRDKNNIRNYYSREIAHLIKYEYQPTQQSSSWISSIVYSCLKLNELYTDTMKQHILDNDLENWYQKSFKDHNIIEDTGMPRQAFPEHKPPGYTLENLSSIDFIERTLMNKAIDDNIRYKVKSIIQKANR